jgi:hypothetical protein
MLRIFEAYLSVCVFQSEDVNEINKKEEEEVAGRFALLGKGSFVKTPTVNVEGLIREGKLSCWRFR